MNEKEREEKEAIDIRVAQELCDQQFGIENYIVGLSKVTDIENKIASLNKRIKELIREEDCLVKQQEAAEVRHKWRIADIRRSAYGKMEQRRTLQKQLVEVRHK